jgi:diguanylate cyclase (GGDEF)-like protein
MSTPGKDEIPEKRILIVDNQPSFRGMVRGCVESYGYSCNEADSGQKALESLKTTHFPIVISHLVRPEMDGLKLVRVIKEKFSDVDVLIITDQETKYSPLKIVQAGANDFLEKPFSKEQLEAKLYKIEKEKDLKDRLYFSSITDELTGLYNRRCFYQKLNHEITRARRQRYPLSIIMFDLNGFKQFNDRYGHLKGDSLLQTVARVLRLSLREHVDSGFRYGGDEFVVILPEADGNTARSIGNRIKRTFKDTAPGGLTLSMGVADYQEDLDTEAFVHLVDERMYKEKKRSKESGESRFEVDLGKDNYYIRCLSCGSLAHWAASICETCLADPRKKLAGGKGQRVVKKSPRTTHQPVKERRKTPRVKIRKTFLHDGLQATIQDMSPEGIQIKTKNTLIIGDKLTIALALENRMVRFGGTVVYLRTLSDGNSLAGLRFFEISEENTRLISSFLESYLSKNKRKESIG